MISLNTVIYADILIVINIIINYFLLRSSAAFIKCEHKTSRFLLSSVTGGLLSLIIFIENINPILNIIIKIISLSVLVLIGFEIKSLKSFLKCFGAFFLSNFIFAGIMLAINTIVVPNASIYKNGIVYFDLNILTLTIVSVICYITIEIISKFTRSKTPEKCIYDIEIVYEESSVKGKALFDSGNTLTDCFSGKPVIIADSSFLKNILDNHDISDMRNFRLIPYSTIKNGGALPAFMADEVTVFMYNQKISVKNIYIAVTDNKIISGGFSALVGMPFFDLIDNKISESTYGRSIHYEKN